MTASRTAAAAAAGLFLVPALAVAQPAASISGRLTTAAGGAPAGGVITAYRDFDNGFMRPLGLVEAAADGSFELRVPAGPAVLNFQAPCFATAQQDINLRAGANGPVNIQL